MTKREEREHLFRILFCKDFHDMEELKEQIDLYQEQLEDVTVEEFIPICKKLEALVEVEGSIDTIQSPTSCCFRKNHINGSFLCNNSF